MELKVGERLTPGAGWRSSSAWGGRAGHALLVETIVLAKSDAE